MMLQPSSGDFFLNHGRQNSAGFELGQLAHDARLGSGGEGYLAVDDMAGNDGAELDGLLGWFLMHTPVRESCVSSVAKILFPDEWITAGPRIDPRGKASNRGKARASRLIVLSTCSVEL